MTIPPAPQVPCPTPPIHVYALQLWQAMDRFQNLLTQARYAGSNSAVASVYAQMRAGLLLVTVVTALTLLFGVAIPLESAAIASGNVVVLSKRKTVQHLEGGLVKSILVKEGDLVKEGQLLMEISNVAPKAHREIVVSELWKARAAEKRVRGLQQGAENIVFSEEMLQAAAATPELQEIIEGQADLFKIQRESFQGKLNTLQQRIVQSEDEIAGLRAQLEGTQGQQKYLAEEIQAIKTLVGKGLAPKMRLLALQRHEEELRGRRGQFEAMIAKTRKNIGETKLVIINLTNEFSTDLAKELGELQSQIHDQNERLTATSDVLARTQIRAPSEGRVTGLKFHTVGGVVAPGESIMEIVPQNVQLVLEVQVSPTDIDVVEPGLISRVALSAYKARRMPVLMGKVTQVSADVFQETEGLQQRTYYKARVEVDANELARLDNHVKLYPGMPADVFIRIGSRTFLGYLFAPIADSMAAAFRED